MPVARRPRNSYIQTFFILAHTAASSPCSPLGEGHQYPDMAEAEAHFHFPLVRNDVFEGPGGVWVFLEAVEELRAFDIRCSPETISRQRTLVELPLQLVGTQLRALQQICRQVWRNADKDWDLGQGTSGQVC